jgi:hypothetical protein
MKVICPISGVPFRTYDSIRMRVAQAHPIFSLGFHDLVHILDEIVEEETKELEKAHQHIQLHIEGGNDLETLAKQHLFSNVIESINERNYRNPAFKLYQAKHLTMLAFMKLAKLLENENGYVARPTPKIIDAYFGSACQLFMWAAGLSNEQVIARLPHYKVSRQNEDMGNLAEYLDLLDEVKNQIGSRYRALSEERKLEALEQGIRILSKRWDVNKQDANGNPLVATWALMITRAPKDVYDFWHAILASKSAKILFEGVTVGGKKEDVTLADLNELKDWLEDNLIGARGERKEGHREDSEPYFMAQQAALKVIRRHLTTVEGGRTMFSTVNAVMGGNVLSLNDTDLEKKALEAGLDPMPNILGMGVVERIKALAKWRNETKSMLVELQKVDTPQDSTSKDKGSSDYEIL